MVGQPCHDMLCRDRHASANAVIAGVGHEVEVEVRSLNQEQAGSRRGMLLLAMFHSGDRSKQARCYHAINSE